MNVWKVSLRVYEELRAFTFSLKQWQWKCQVYVGTLEGPELPAIKTKVKELDRFIRSYLEPTEFAGSDDSQ